MSTSEPISDKQMRLQLVTVRVEAMKEEVRTGSDNAPGRGSACKPRDGHMYSDEAATVALCQWVLPWFDLIHEPDGECLLQHTKHFLATDANHPHSLKKLGSPDLELVGITSRVTEADRPQTRYIL